MYILTKEHKIHQIDEQRLIGKTIENVKQKRNRFTRNIDHFLIEFTDGSSVEFTPDSYTYGDCGCHCFELEQELDVHFSEEIAE